MIVILIIGLALLIAVNIFVKSKTVSLIYHLVDEVPNENVAIIFGAGIRGEKPSTYLKDRLDAGIELYKAKKVSILLLSGDNGDNKHDEVSVMKMYCYEKGVDTTKIFVDYAGFDTYSTMYRAKYIFNIHKAILVSQEFHLNRAIYIGNKIGLKSVGLSADVGKYKTYNYVRFREFFSVLKAVIDIARNRKPHILGDNIDIQGVSNYTKNDQQQ